MNTALLSREAKMVEGLTMEATINMVMDIIVNKAWRVQTNKADTVTCKGFLTRKELRVFATTELKLKEYNIDRVIDDALLCLLEFKYIEVINPTEDQEKQLFRPTQMGISYLHNIRQEKFMNRITKLSVCMNIVAVLIAVISSIHSFM